MNLVKQENLEELDLRWGSSRKISFLNFHYFYSYLFSLYAGILSFELCLSFSSLIITITNSSILIGAFAASFCTNHSIQLKSDNVIRQLAVIRQLKQSIILSPLS